MQNYLEEMKNCKLQLGKERIWNKVEREVFDLQRKNEFKKEDLDICIEIFKHMFKKEVSGEYIEAYFQIRNITTGEKERLTLEQNKIIEDTMMKKMKRKINYNENISIDYEFEYLIGLPKNQLWSDGIDNPSIKRVINKFQNKYIEIDKYPESDDICKIDKWLAKLEIMQQRSRYTMLYESMHTGAEMPKFKEIEELKRKYIKSNTDKEEQETTNKPISRRTTDTLLIINNNLSKGKKISLPGENEEYYDLCEEIDVCEEIEDDSEFIQYLNNNSLEDNLIIAEKMISTIKDDPLQNIIYHNTK